MLPALTYLASLLFHEKRSDCIVLGAMTASFASTHGGFHRSRSQSASCVSLCLKSGYLSVTFSGLQSHHCEGSVKNCCQSVSLRSAVVGPPFPPQVVTSALLPQVTIRPNRCNSRVSWWCTAITTGFEEATELRGLRIRWCPDNGTSTTTTDSFRITLVQSLSVPHLPIIGNTQQVWKSPFETPAGEILISTKATPHRFFTITTLPKA